MVRGHPASVLHFDPESWVTAARQTPYFTGVSPQRAAYILAAAHPARWAEAAPAFFKRSEPGRWDPARQHFQPIEGLERHRVIDGEVRAFELLEHVEWDLRPLSQGGGVNILEISEFEQTAMTLAYRYRLVHCIQTKFLATWEPGGLDVDEGYYRAEWSEAEGGTLRVDAEKRLRYARDGEVLPGFSTMLNLMAPALTSLLMSQLAFYGILDYLLGRSSPEGIAPKLRST